MTLTFAREGCLTLQPRHQRTALIAGRRFNGHPVEIHIWMKKYIYGKMNTDRFQDPSSGKRRERNEDFFSFFLFFFCKGK